MLILLAGFHLQAQTNLTFNKRFVECEDKWVSFHMDKDSTHVYGFIYIDEEAGLTLNLEGKFKINQDNSYQIEKNTKNNVKIRLVPNDVRVAIIPETMFEDLQIDSIPEWLSYYKTNENTVGRLYKWGFMYNGWNECEKALGFLLKAKSIDANYEGLAVEIAYSYNCLKDYDNAIIVLEEAINENPTSAYVNKELIYTLVKSEQIEDAIEAYNTSVKLNVENTYNAENCFNILGYYYEKKDRKNFDFWKKELKKWPNSNEQITNYVKLMDKELK